MTLTPVSEWLAGVVSHSYLKYGNIQVIPNGIDIDIFKPTGIEHIHNLECKQKTEELEGKFVIIAVSSLWNGGEKGLDDFISMSALLKEDEVIVLVGMPDKIIESLPSNIIGIKRTNNQRDLAALYSRANVVCSLSSAETFGLTIIEGYACGTPAVVYNNTAMPALISQETGIVVKNKDYIAAYNAIQEIKENGKKTYSKACINLVHEKYDKNKCFEKFIDLYNSLIKNEDINNNNLF